MRTIKNKKYSIEMKDVNVVVNEQRITSILKNDTKSKSNKGSTLNKKKVAVKKSLSEFRKARQTARKEGMWSLFLFANTYRQFTGVSYEFILKKIKDDKQMRELLRTKGIFKRIEDPNPKYEALSKRYKVIIGKEKEFVNFIRSYLLKEQQRLAFSKKFGTSL